MTLQQQHTVANIISCEGIGLHSGQKAVLKLLPAPVDHGIVFRRTDVAAETSTIPARYDLVSETMLGTTLTNAHGVSVATVEHLMAAFWGAGIDNVIVEIDGPEIPIMDGSSEPFMFLIECAGRQNQKAPRRFIEVLKPITLTHKQSTLTLTPSEGHPEGFTLDIEIDFDHTLISRQVASYDFRRVTFKQALSRARTFGFEHEVQHLQSIGLARGGSLENAVVLGKDKVLNEGGLRYNDEFVRHKALDCVGDFFLAGLRLHAHATVSKPGHQVNNLLIRALMSDESAWRVTGGPILGFVAVPAVAQRIAASQPSL